MITGYQSAQRRLVKIMELTSYSSAALVAAVGLTLVPLSSDAAAINFERDIFPILKENCVSCHRQAYKEGGKLKKPKGKLRLDGRRGLIQGGENGKIIVTGKPEKSSIYTSTTLDKDDPDIMPQKGDLLTKKQTELIRNWIVQGARLGEWKGNEKGFTDTPTPTGGQPDKKLTTLDRLAKTVSPLPANTLNSARAKGVYTHALAQGNPLLYASFLGGAPETDDGDLNALTSLRNHITHLDLSRTKITDSGLRAAAGMPRLTQLDLHSTAVTDKGIAALAQLRVLSSLNLYGTKVSDKAVPTLARMQSLKNIYVWQTGITKKGASELRKKLPNATIHFETTLGQTSPTRAKGTDGKATAAGKTRKSMKRFDANSCCAKAAAKGSRCQHACCKAAARDKKVCTKCNPGKK